jgi:glycosyltransferase involved in cell wall biosynthesis
MMQSQSQWDWNVAVFCRNEQTSIARCIASIAEASRDRRVVITLIVNGSTDHSADAALAAARQCGAAIVIHTIQHGDKANAMNWFFYHLREDAALYFFVDAYTKIGVRALATMERILATNPTVTAATGIAVNGRTMRRHAEPTLTQGGRLHGQLHALRNDFITRLVAQKIRIPIGLYYGDGLLGSIAMHDLDPLGVVWDPKRIGSDPEATYEIPVLSIIRVQDLKRQFHRKIRQMRGRLENLAIRRIVYHHGYEALPEYADDMIQAYLAENRLPNHPPVDRLFQFLALRQIKTATRPDPARLKPVLHARLAAASPQLLPA